MTITSDYAPQQYTGNGVTTVFSFPYPFYDNTDLIVSLTVIATGVTTVQTITTHYSVSGGGGSSGSVTMVTAPTAAQRLTIERSIPYRQTQDYTENTAFPAETLEQGMDRAVVMAQQVKSLSDYSLKFPTTDALSSIGTIPGSVTRANSVLSFDADGVPSAVALGSLVTSFDSVFTSLADDDLLKWDSGTSKWVNAAQINATNIPNTTITAAMLNSGAATSGQVPIANGSGGVAYGNLTSLTEDVITAADSVIFSDASDSGNTKRDTVQGILDLVSAGGLVYLGSATASSSATLDFTSLITSTYDTYVFEFLHIASSSGATLDLRTSTNNGSSWSSTAGDYRWWYGNGSSSATTWNGDNSGNSQTVGRVWSSLTSDGFCGFLKYYQASGGLPSYVLSLLSFDGSNSRTILGGGCRTNSTYVNAIRFLPGSGTITSGTIRLYGVKKS